MLAALEPVALERSLAAADDLHQERARLHRVRQQERERTCYEAERARRQYDAVAPEKRLVARELERRWEETLKEQRRLEEEYARFCRSQPAGRSAAEREPSRSLARDLPALWQASGTTAADRQRVGWSRRSRLLSMEALWLVHGDLVPGVDRPAALRGGHPGLSPGGPVRLRVALVAFNLMAVLKGALASEHGQAVVEQELSSYYVAEEVSSPYAGMQRLMPAALWEPWERLTPAALAAWLGQVARQIPWKKYKKSKRGPRKPSTVQRTRRGAQRSTARVLQNRQNK